MTDYYVLHSGGLDSTVALTIAKQRANARNVYSTNIDYGQRHIKELEAASQIAEILNTEQFTLDLTGYGQSVTSALTNPAISIPEGDYDEVNMATTVVPGRNAVMLAALAGVAVSHSAGHPVTIMIGVHAGDHHLYPDCRPEFITAQSEALKLATGVDVEAPFINLDKGQIVRIGHSLGAPLELTWSCYKGGRLHCGKCGTCLERKEAFTIAGVEDPTEYMA